MKKKSLMFLITVTLVIAAFVLAGPASAGKRHQRRAVFQADIVPLDGQALYQGRVVIRNDGKFKVAIKGAGANTDYNVWLVYGDPTYPISEDDLGILMTNKKGKGEFYGEVCVPECFVHMPRIELRYGGTVHYVSGFAPVICDDPPVDDPPVDDPPIDDPPDGGIGGVLGDFPGL